MMFTDVELEELAEIISEIKNELLDLEEAVKNKDQGRIIALAFLFAVKGPSIGKTLISVAKRREAEMDSVQGMIDEAIDERG